MSEVAYIYPVFVIPKGFNLFDKLVMWFTRSKIAHVAYYLEDENKLIEPQPYDHLWNAYWYYNTLEKHKNEILEIYRLQVTSEQKFLTEKWLKYLANTKTFYNYLGVLGFILPFFTSNGGYFCSEGVYDAMQFADIIKSDLPGWQINPVMLRSIVQDLGGELYKKLYIDNNGKTRQI